MIDVSTEIGHSIEIRRDIQWIAMRAASVPALLVREEHDHVRLFAHNRGGTSIVTSITLVQ